MSSPECERGLLGSILSSDYARVMGLCCEARLEPEAFTTEDRRLIYRVCAWLTNEKHPIDTTIVSDRLKQYGKLEEVGGPVAIDRLIDDAPTPTHAEYYLREVKNKWLLRQIEEEGRTTIKSARNSEREPQDVLASHIQRLVTLAGSECVKSPSKERVWADVRKSAYAARGGAPIGVPAPWPSFSKHTGGAPFGRVCLVAGRTKTRKSYLVHQWGVYASILQENPMPGAYYPLEDGQRVGMSRAACALAGVDCWTWEHGKFSDEEAGGVEAAAQRIIKSHYDIRRGRGMSMAQMRLDIARGVSKNKWRFVIIDAFKDMDVSGGSYQDEGKLSKWTQDVAEEFDIALMVVHHVRKNRSEGQTKEDRTQQRLRLEDVRGHSRIGEDARMIVVLQCKLERNNFGEAHYHDYLLDCVANNYGETAASCLDIEEGTGVFTENNERKPWLDADDSSWGKWG